MFVIMIICGERYCRRYVEERGERMIGETIKKKRIEKGLSLNELALLSKVSKSYLSYIERGIQKEPSPHIISRIAKVLNTSIEELLHEDMFNDRQIDYEWLHILKDGIDYGMRKDELRFYVDFIKFQKKKVY